jgi:hypothetical protein
MDIQRKTIEVQIYITEKGEEMPLGEMSNEHLVNAAMKAHHLYEECDNRERHEKARLADVRGTLRGEIIRRIENKNESE